MIEASDGSGNAAVVSNEESSMTLFFSWADDHLTDFGIMIAAFVKGFQKGIRG